MTSERRLELPGWKGLEESAKVAAAMERGDWYANLSTKAAAAGSAVTAKAWGNIAVEAYKEAATLAEKLRKLN